MSKTTEPMDPSAKTAPAPVAESTNERNAYTIDTIIAEVTAIFPDVTYEVGDRLMRNVATSVTFDLADGTASTTPEGDEVGLADLLPLLVNDERVIEALYDEREQRAYVRVYSNPRTQDSRETFHIAQTWDVLIGNVE